MICYCKVTTLAPRHRDTRRMLGLAYCVLGQRDKAIELYEEWLKEEPDHPVVAHLLAGCTGRDVPSRASDECVQIIFDGFAESFESKLAHLHYRAPALVHAMLEDSGRQPTGSLDVLDAGCGTGLCGPLICHLLAARRAADLLQFRLSGGTLVAAAYADRKSRSSEYGHFDRVRTALHSGRSGGATRRRQAIRDPRG